MQTRISGAGSRQLERLDKLIGSYTEDCNMRTRLQGPHTKRALEGIEENIRHPRAYRGQAEGLLVRKIRLLFHHPLRGSLVRVEVS